jgi:thiol-disulfide isomerase/thioredoxin
LPKSSSRALVVGVPIVVVLAILVALIGIKLSSSGGSVHASKVTNPPLPAPGVLTTAISSVPQSVLAAAGLPADVPSPVALSGAPPLTSDGKPEVLFVGAEWCPYCAAERWALTQALSRFGAFSGLGTTSSSTSDVYPGTQTLSYYGSSYTSGDLVFVPVETATNTYTPLQKPTPPETAILQRYDRPPYASVSGSVPFIDIGNKWIVSGASYSPKLLAGMDQSQIAAAMSDPSSAVGTLIDGAANRIAAAICSITGSQPASACPGS